jgi:two-component system sensor histidine kinase ChiS
MATPERVKLLIHALRAAASHAAELAGAESSLVFAAVPDEPDGPAPSRLRAAAGFASVDEAQATATALATSVAQCIRQKQSLTASGAHGMGSRGIEGFVLIPLLVEDRLHGVMAVGASAPFAPAASETVGLLAATMAIHIDHFELSDEVKRLRVRGAEEVGPPGDEGEELLKLSETLFAQDIELLRSNEKLGQIEKIKSDFIEKMSRELRTPLNSIIESTISVLAGENENLSEGAKQCLRNALDEGTTYQRTLQNILDLWRIKQGEMPVEIQDLNFAEIVDEAIFSVQDTLKDKAVTIEKVIEAPFPKIKTDLAKLNQILFLLLDNAAKFTNDGQIEIVASVENGILRCQIRDTGIGICPDDQEYIFDEFFQVDDRSFTRYRGAGLGLSLVRDLLTLLEGQCMISSEAGRGTAAIIEIPVQIA